MTLSELKRLKALEEENTRLKRMVAQQALDNELLGEISKILDVSTGKHGYLSLSLVKWMKSL